MATTQARSGSQGIEVGKLALRLRRLWMGTLYIGVFAIYTLLLGLLLVYYGWRPALLSLFLIGLIQLFRYVADDVDRIGWLLGRGAVQAEHDGIIRHRSKLQYLLLALMTLLNLALVYQAYLVSGWERAAALVLGLALVEVMFREIRATNRRIDYRSPAYGIRQPDPITGRPGASRLDEKLTVLRQLADRGDISRKAYEKARDRALIERVMAE